MTSLARHAVARLLLLFGSVAWGCAGAASNQADAAGRALPLQFLGTTPVTGYHGDFDHLAADVAGRRLFVAGEDGGTIEVFDLSNGKRVGSVQDPDTPHALRWLPASRRLLVTHTGGEGLPAFLDGDRLNLVERVDTPRGADAMGFDPATQRAWIVTGGRLARPPVGRTTLAEIDVQTGRMLGTVDVETDFVEGIAFEQAGTRAFVNLAGRGEVAVFDKRTRERLATWPIADARQNSAIALDEAHGRLFVVTREPSRLVVIDTTTGRGVASLRAPARTNDLFFDAAEGRLYLTGDGYVATFEQLDADHYRELARVPSAKGAKTGLLVPELGLLCVAVAGSDTTPAALLRYRIERPTVR